MSEHNRNEAGNDGGSITVALPDWTWDETGRSNSSPEFIRLCAEVERLIRGDAFTLMAGRADSTARLIMAQLAHVHKLAPPRSLGRLGW